VWTDSTAPIMNMRELTISSRRVYEGDSTIPSKRKGGQTLVSPVGECVVRLNCPRYESLLRDSTIASRRVGGQTLLPSVWADSTLPSMRA
jgi:hypothetical protein